MRVTYRVWLFTPLSLSLSLSRCDLEVKGFRLPFCLSAAASDSDHRGDGGGRPKWNSKGERKGEKKDAAKVL